MRKIVSLFLIALLSFSCHSPESDIPVVGFADAFEDNTIAQAKQGFFDALKKNGYSEENKTLNIIYRNAQGDIPKLTLSIKYFIDEHVSLIATSPSLSTITALQNTKDIPVFMLVSPTPELMKLTDAQGNGPPNLFGVAETLGYIDTSFSMIPQLVKPYGTQLRVGMIYNQSEPQSADALKRIEGLAAKLHIELVSLPVNNSAEVQLVTHALLSKHIDAFFANPDNTVFSSFETILKACTDSKVPVFTSEAGLVARGAVAAYGADLYQWGYQAGEQAALFLKHKSTQGLHWEMVKLRKRVYNTAAIKNYGIAVKENTGHSPATFWLTALVLGLCLAAMALGIFISMKIFNIPDITTDGSYTLGAVITAILLSAHWNTGLIIPVVLLSGALAGTLTGLIHTSLKIDALLSGILVMTGLYSINLTLLGRSNVPLLAVSNVFSSLHFFSIPVYNDALLGLLFIALIVLILSYVLRTDFGIAMRATGNSASMTRAMGINNNKMKILGLAMANSLTALAGYLVAQYQNFTDINMGIGIVITGLGSVLIGEALIKWRGIRSIGWQLVVVACGSILFQLVLAFTLSIGVDPNLLKLVTASFVLLIVLIPRLKRS